MWNDPSGKNPNGPNGSGDGSGRYPGTGDDSNMLPWMALMISSAGALTVLWTLRRKKKNQ